jgi:hypothetical protein
MLKKSAGIVLAAPRGSTYHSVRLASSTVLGLPDVFIEHPAEHPGIKQCEPCLQTNG